MYEFSSQGAIDAASINLDAYLKYIADWAQVDRKSAMNFHMAVARSLPKRKHSRGVMATSIKTKVKR